MIPRMRGLAEAIDEIKAQDPDSAITLHALRRMVAEGKIPCIKCGRRILINMEQLSDYLNSGMNGIQDKPSGRDIKPIL